MGDYAKAEPLYQQALQDQQKALGPEHPDTAQASTIWRRCISLWAITPKPNRSISERWRFAKRSWAGIIPTTAQSLNNLAELYQATGDYAKSRTALQRSAGDSPEGPG